MEKLVIKQPLVFAWVKPYQLTILSQAHQIPSGFAERCTVQRPHLSLTAKFVHCPRMAQHVAQYSRSVRLKHTYIDIAVSSNCFIQEQIQCKAAANCLGKVRIGHESLEFFHHEILFHRNTILSFAYDFTKRK